VRRRDWFAAVFATAAVYFGLIGIGWGVEYVFAPHPSLFNWWHPGLAAFLGTTSTAVLLAFVPPSPTCDDCEKLKGKLSRTRIELQQTRQALLELAPPPKEDSRG
jgi:hypothetical protein